ncbi:MAG: TetR/AcrR family transcriptional regulator, partial [Streptosporangiaceae bacterium]
RQRDPRMDAALVEAVLDLVGGGATLSGLSLSAIAERAGVSRNSLYRRWKTKEALYLDVLAQVNRPLPELSGRSARDDVTDLVAVLAERAGDRRASVLLRALNAELETFPGLHKRYFAEVVAPRREAMSQALQRGIAAGEIRADIDIGLVSELLVSPLLARMSRGETEDSDPVRTSHRITALVFAGIAPR